MGSANSIDILVIDDMDEVLDLTQAAFDMLGDERIRLHKARTGKQGLDLYEKVKPQVILTDYEMPNGNGAYVLREIRNIDPSAKVIFMSGLSSVRSTARKLGATDFVLKPFSLMILPKQLIAYATDEGKSELYK